MNQTTTAATNAHPVDLEALRVQLEEDGRVYTCKPDSEEAHERLLHTLQTNDCREIITTVVDGDDLAWSFVRAGNRNHVDIVEAFLHHGMNVNIKNNNGETALMYASVNRHVGIVEMLLENNANLDLQDSSGMTTLMHASVNGNKNIVQVLLIHGADIELKDNEGKTALDLTRYREIKELIRNHVTISGYVLK